MTRKIYGQLAAVAAISLALSLSGCGKKEEAKPAAGKTEAKAGEKKGEAKADDKKAAEGEKKADEKKAAEAPAAGGDNVVKAKALVDKMAGKMEEMLKEIEGAKGDQAKIKEIGEKFKKFAESNKTEGEALNKALKPEEKKTVDEYARKKMAPLMGKFMAVMMKARPGAPGGAAPAAAAAPAGDAAKPAAAPAGDAAKPAAAPAEKPAEKK